MPADAWDHLVDFEERCVDEGYTAGFAAGQKEAIGIGRQWGYRKGYELGIELGYYHAILTHWIATTTITDEKCAPKSCLMYRIKRSMAQALELIDAFPSENCPDVDIEGCIKRIRIKIKLLASQRGEMVRLPWVREGGF